MARRLSILHLLLAVGTLLFFAPTRATAQDIPEQDLVLAKQHYELGKTYYEQGAYDKALEAFEQSYAYSKKPALLYNIAKCYETLGQLEQAIANYRRFLTERGSSDPTIKARIHNLENRLKEQERGEAGSAAAVVPPTTAESPGVPASQPAPAAPITTPHNDTSVPPAATPGPSTEPNPQPSRWMKWTGWSLIGVGAVSLATSFVFGARAKAKSDLVEEAYLCPNDPDPSDNCLATQQSTGAYTWTQINQDIASKGKAFEAAQIATLVAGAVIGAAGVVLVAFAPSHERAQARALHARRTPAATIAPMLSPEGVGIAGNVAF